MLFDLRARGRKRTVQAIYLFLAVLLGGGLILFGVGTGSSGGGLFGAFLGNGSGGNQSSVVTSQVKAALRETQQDPSNPQAWSGLVSARWEAASNTLDSTTDTYTAAGKTQLAGALTAWQHYLTLTKNPDPDIAILAARAAAHIGDYSQAAAAWQDIAAANPNEVNAYACLAMNAYAGKQSRVGDLASAKAEELAPKASRTQLKTEITAAKTQPTVAQSC